MGNEIVNSQVKTAISSNGRRKSIEEALTNIWSAVLGQARIEKHANFFEIGGDSLKAMEVISRVRELLQADLPLISFFEEPTIEHLAGVLLGGRTELEDAIAGIWADVLGVPYVDKGANFFEIGGDSLKAMEVIAKVSDLLHVDLPLIAFFEEPTVRHLADVLSSGQESTAEQLAEIWKAVLGVSQVEMDASFFDIGGDSLKVMDAIVRVSEVMNVDLPLIAFFEEPTLAHLADVVDSLKSAGTTPPITRAADGSEFPLSFSQRVFWLLEQQNPGTGLYNKPRVFRIHGKVDREVMERSLQELRRRHEVLRVKFVSGVNGPVQIVEQDGNMEFTFTDLSMMEPVRREQLAMKLALETVRKPLDLANAQVQRARLMQFSDDEFLLCISEHHVVNDGFTGSILLDELGAIYDAFAAGEPNPLPPPKLHYTDFAAWEQQWMQAERLAEEVEYWRALLQTAPTHLSVPTDFSPNTEPDRRGNLRSLTLSPQLFQRMQLFAQTNGTTQFVVMATVLRLLLYRWSGHQEFLLGTTASNRSRSGTERMPGPFVNPLPLRNAVHPSETAAQLLNREKRTILEAFAHQDCPFAKIVEAVNPERTSNDNPLFNVGLVMENFPEIGLKGQHFEADYLNFDPEVSLLDLRFIAVEKDGGLRLSCEYCSGLFLPETVDALLQGCADVLAGMMDSPQKALAEFELPRALTRHAEATAIARQYAVAIAATYTAEPIQEPLQFWLRQLGLPDRIEFAPFSQVFQQLLDPSSLFAKNAHGVNVALLRIEDLGQEAESIETGVAELVEGLRSFGATTRTPLLVVIGPASKAVQARSDVAQAIEKAEQKLETAAKLDRVAIVTARELLEHYPVLDYDDEYGYKISHVPYKPALFTALAAMVARSLYSVARGAPELIVLDSATLFSERDRDALEPSHTVLQEFMFEQQNGGAILALCGSESENEVSTKFASAPKESLGWQDFAASRFGVTAKSVALKELAEEIGLSPEHCIYVTADGIDAREVRTNCPAVTVAELPQSMGDIRGYLRNFWGFDRSVSTGVIREIPLRCELLNRIASDLASVESITRAFESTRTKRARFSDVYEAPRSAEEEFLADVWSRLLRVERPSIHDNFFALGGHSLVAAQVIARVRQALGVELPLRAMFEAPTIAGFAELIEAERRARTGVVVPPITRVPRGPQLPLSYAQQRLWFIDQLEPGSPAYNISAMYRMRGQLKVEALERTINEIVRRHESLRTTFHNVDGHPVAVIAPEISISLAPRQLSEIDQEAELRRRAHKEATAPFDLSVGPLVRARLLRISEGDHVLLIIVHHIVGDGWSGSLIAGELAALYEAFAHYRPSPLPELAIQYTDFAVWQRQWLEGEVHNRQVDYWRKQLTGAPAVLELPTDRPRPAVQSHRGDVCLHVIPSELIERLTFMSQNDGATLFMTMFAAFQVLLSRYSGQEDIVVGSTIAGRGFAEIEPLIGFFVNTLAMRASVSGNPTFREFLTQVRQVALDAYAHQDLPFEKLVEELQPQRSLSYNPVFQVLFGLQNMPRRYFEASGLNVERSSIHQSTSILDMSWFAFPVADGMLLRVEYDTDLFDASTIERMIGHYQTLLEGIASRPDSRIADLPILSAEEERQLLVEFNQTSRDYPQSDLLQAFVAQQAEATPDAVALIVGNERLSYRELNARANQLAHYLQKQGAGPETLVGIYCERSAEMLVGILGALKAGSAYVPLDPNYPKERIRAILEDAKLHLVLTQSAIARDLPDFDGQRICLDTEWPLISQGPTGNPEVKTTRDNLAYVLFTSGSTGRPKGVAIEHRSVATFVHWAREAFERRELAGVLFSTSMCFDLSVFEMFATLSVGGAIIVAENALYLPTLPAQNEVTLINTVPSAIAELVRMGGIPDSVRTVNLAGEALPESLVAQIYENTNVERVYNLYGPTEDTTYSTYTLVPRRGRVTIGRPLPNSQAYVLDACRRPVPIGVPGELYLAGEGLARGYYGRDDFTRERFVRNPFSNESGARMYGTGDVCRYLPDGQIEYLGRIDHQVKVRGFRIELGEIEAAIADCVRQCVVMAREDVPGDKRLVAYVVPRADAQARAELITEMRRRIAEKLPEFMMPSAFVVLEEMPLSPNGKINRSLLPVPELSRDEKEAYIAPRNPVEEKLAEIWREVLRISKVGVQDNFFALGGHSLLATQVVARIRRAMGVDLPLRELFERPTIAELASRIARSKTSESATRRSIERVPRDGALPLSFAQQRLWFLNQLEPNNPIYNIPLAIRLKGVLHIPQLNDALDEIIRRHEVLRTRYVVVDDRPVQVISEEWGVDLPLVDISGLSAETQNSEIQRMAIENGRHVFNLQTGPVFRASLLRLEEHDHILLLNMHHIVSDGWSIWRFVEELAILYGAFIEGKPSPLVELPIQYADFAVWQRSWLQTEILAEQLAYWKKKLDGVPSSLDIPTAHTRPAVPSYRGSTCTVMFPHALVEKLNELGRREGVTLFMTLLTAHQALLFRYSRQDDFTVGSPIANRVNPEIEELIGFFVNTVVMRADMSGNPTFRELLKRVRNTALEAYSNQDVPFERLVEELRPERDLGRTPLFQVLFVVQNAPKIAFRLSGLDMSAMDVHNGTSKFDMAIFIVERHEGLQCKVEYSSELFDASTIERMLRHYQCLLEAAMANPDAPISQLPLLTNDERQQLLMKWNETESTYPRDLCMHELFAIQAHNSPDRIAVVCGDQQLSYGELNALSNQLARYLQGRGVGRETLVGLMIERSTQMLVALLGIMKAGGIYLPLDPNLPKDRIEFILNDAEVAILLTQKHLAVSLPATGTEQVHLDVIWPSLAAQSKDDLPATTGPENRVYVLYTSGSTGKPKGVEVEHRNLTNFLASMQVKPGLAPDDTLLAVTTLSFDIAGLELYLPLIYGAKVALATREQAANGEELGQLVTSSGATVMQATPATWRMLLEAGWPGNSKLKILCGGEAFPPDLANQLLPVCSELWNMYGPTETTIWSSVYKIDRELTQVASIGRPIANTTMYVLDSHGQPTPIGVPGELYIGGVGVARGYLNRPELTDERFLPDPFRPGGRVYRTGDLAFFLPDGNIQFLGRADFQVKLRGFRVELGEIETALDSHPGVRQNVVVAREDNPGDTRLVAYVVPNPEYRGPEQREPEAVLGSEQIAQWAEAWDEAYREGGGVEDATFNIKGWNSSYTGEPIPSEEMRVWVETTVERIKSLRAKSVWEIGCGTGLLLFRVAPASELYYGTDISQTALSFLEQQLQQPESRLPQVRLERKPAHEFDGPKTRGQFDAVIMNSVIQYFPDLHYLMTVLQGAVESVRPGGAVFIGDVRSLPLLGTFHTSVEVFRADDCTSRQDLARRVQKGIRQEGELVVDPEFFNAIRNRWPRITHLEIQLKRGRAHNELTRFRYDVVLHIGEQAPPRVGCPWLDWKKQGLTCALLAEILRKTQPEMLGVTGVPNARLRAEAVAVEWLAAEEGTSTIGDLRPQVTEDAFAAAIEPEDLWSLEQELPYQLEVRASKAAVDGCCDVVLRRRNAEGEVADYAVTRFPGETDAIRPWATYANNPLRERIAGKLVPQLRQYLGGKLPDYMVPSAFVLLDSMPLTGSGKVNRRALPAPEQSSTDALGDYRAPQTPTEEMIATIFADVLRLDRVGRDDNFFELGGHSLSATQVVSRIRQYLRVDLPVRTVFESPAVATLARAAEQTQRGEQGLIAPPIDRVPRDHRLPLSFAQQRLWVLDQIEPNNPLYNIPRPLRLAGVLNVAALESALNAIVARHEVLRTRYGSKKGQPFQIIADELIQPLKVVDLTGFQSEEREKEAHRQVEEEAATPFDLANDPIIRYQLLKLGDEDHILMVTTHHIADDGWSTGILLRELTELYEAAVNGDESQLPVLSIQYADYAVWQRNWLQGEVLQQQVGYWRYRLDGAPPVLLVPTDRSRPEKPTFRGATHRFLLPTSLLELVRSLSRQQGGTAFMTMLAGFQTLMLHYTKQPDIVLGTDLANRSTVQTEALIGFFVNLLPLRTDLSGDPTFIELLARVREVALGAYAHQDVPFDKLVEELQPERSLSHNPIVQVLFVQQNTPRSAKPMPGLALSWFPMNVPSKFDMAVFVSETDKGVAGNWVYSSELFDASTIARMAELYQVVMEKATAHPTLRLSQLIAALEDEDQKQLAAQHREFQQAGSQKLKTAKRKTLTQN